MKTLNPNRHRGWPERIHARPQALPGHSGEHGIRRRLEEEDIDLRALSSGTCHPFDEYPYDWDQDPAVSPYKRVAGLLHHGPFGVRLDPLLPAGPEAGTPEWKAPNRPPDPLAVARSVLRDCDAHQPADPESELAACELNELFDRCGIGLASLTGREQLIMTLLVASRRFWLRPPQAWTPPGGTRLDQLLNLVEHLMGRYPVPEWLRPIRLLEGYEDRYRGWESWDRTEALNDAPPWSLYLAATQGWKLGHALRLWAKTLGLELPTSSARFAFEVPRMRTFDAIIWLKVRTLGGSAEVAGALLENHAIHCPRLFAELVDLLTRNPSLVPHAREIGEWAMHEFTELVWRRCAGPVAQGTAPTASLLAGRSAANVLQHANAYFEARSRKVDDMTWESRGWSLETELEGITWSFTELTTGAALADESRVMHHCVSTYAAGCQEGHSAIVSARVNGQRVLTIEVAPVKLQVVQVRGSCNRPPTPAESNAVQNWCRHFGLGILQ